MAFEILHQCQNVLHADSMFVEVIGEKLVGRLFFPPPFRIGLKKIKPHDHLSDARL